MNRVSFILVSLVLLAITGCNNVGYKRTSSGLMYKIISDEKNPVVKRGDWLKIHLRRTVRDSVLDETYSQAPIYIQSDSFPAAYDPREILPLLRKGDSATVVIFGDSILKRQGNLPPFMRAKDKLLLHFKVVDVFTDDSTKINDETAEMSRAQEKQRAEFETKKTATIKEMEDYFASKKINYQKTKGGTYVVITEQGNGPACDTGKIAHVIYKGTMFKTDRVFDQNMDGSRQPYPVQIGAPTGVIAGWLEGLPYFNKGGKGFLYVPFWQGYGPQPSPMNTPYANMTFEIEIADVTDGAAQPSPAPPPPNR